MAWAYIQCKNRGWLDRHTDYPPYVFGPLVNLDWPKRRIAKAVAAWHRYARQIFHSRSFRDQVDTDGYDAYIAMMNRKPQETA